MHVCFCSLYFCSQLVEALCYKSEGRGFDSRWCHWNFSWHNPSGRTMALGSTQPLTEMSTRNISWGQRRPVRRADNLTTFVCRLSWNLGTSPSWNPQGLFRPIMGLLYLYMFWAAMCPSSGELIVSIRHLIYVTLYRWPSGVQVCTPDGHLYRVTYARCRIDTINPPDDGHMAARNM